MAEVGEAAGAAPAPAWLTAAFPGHEWQSLRSCRLSLDEEGGAGLDLEASELGYLVDGVEEEPGQDPALRAGTVIIEIGGCSLLGQDEESLEEAFGGHFRDGAQLLLLDTEELRQAKAAREAQAKAGPQPDLVLEHGSVVHVYLCSAKDMDAMAEEARAGLKRDLETFAEKVGVRVEIYQPQGEAAVSVVLAGVPGEISASRHELGALLQHHGLGAGANDAAPRARGAESIEVGGLVMQSLPARGRRRRRAPEDDEAGRGEKKRAEGGDAEQAEGGEGEDGEDGERVHVGGEEVRQYEYRDHTADVILHSWGTDLKQAFEQVCVAFFSYMTDLDKVELRTSFEVEATGHDILDLLYHLLDEFLFNFGTEFVMCRRVEVLEFDEPGLRVRARGYGERFDLSKHPQGTEIKAITMHQMKILTPDTLTFEDGTIPRKESDKEGGGQREGFPFECYVLVDI